MKYNTNLWNSLKENIDWFIATNGKVCQKYDNNHFLMYVRGPYAPPLRLIHLEYSDEFGVARLATDEEINSKVSDEDRKNNEKEDFVFVAKSYENPQYASKRFEKEYLEHVMSKAKYNQSKAAMLLGISRGTLRTRLEEHFYDKYLSKRGQ